MNIAILGFFTPWIIYAVISILHYALPARKVTGYVRNPDTGEPLQYRLNGRLVLVLSMGIWFLIGYLGWVDFGWLYTIRWWSLAGACVLGLIFTAVIVLPHASTGKSLFADLFLGRLENPQWFSGRVDAKMWLYLIGAVMLELNALSFAAHHVLEFGAEANPGVILCTLMITYFVFDYLTFEEVHLYTYDFFAERVGFKLGWGCLVFYPYFYSVALWATVHLPHPGIENWQLVLYALIFLGGWTLARGANMQKFYFKTRPQRSFLGITPQTITDGNKSLLVNGFWGVSRHVNYLGEILMGCGIALAVGYPSMIWPWLYPLYYVALLFPRQIDDDKRCAAKYGDLWQQYVQKVKYRIIPFVY